MFNMQTLCVVMKGMVTSVIFHSNRYVKWQTLKLFKYYKRTLYTMIPQVTLPRALVYPKETHSECENVTSLHDEIWTTKPYCGGSNTIPLTDEVVRMPNILGLFRHKGDMPENAIFMFIKFPALTSNHKEQRTLITRTLLHLCQRFC